MWRIFLCMTLGFGWGISSPAWAEGVHDTCSQLATGIGQFEKVRTVCDTGGIDAEITPMQPSTGRRCAHPNHQHRKQ